MDIKPNMDVTPDGLHKSAIIYRDDSARFIYVCFHCGCTFNEINETLQHIESHFQLANVAIEQSSIDYSRNDYLTDCFALQSLATQETVDIKIEPDNKKYAVEDVTPMPRSDLPSSEDVNRKFRCKVCNSLHSSTFLVRLHALTTHINEPMRCCLCKTTFTRIIHFENHLKKHITKGDVNWKSVIEGIPRSLEVDWSTYEEEVDHRATVKEEKPQTAPSFPVPSSTTAKRSRARVTKKRTYSRPYRCHKCHLKCRYMNALRTHFQTHTDDELLIICRCIECDIFYKNPFELRIHVLEVHRMIEKFSCNACELQFDCAQSEQFEEHLELHNNGPNENKVWRDIRDGVFEPKDFDYSKYEEIDSFTEEQHSCEFCTQRFHLRSNLDLHMKGVHHGQRRLQCGQCAAVFTTPKVIFFHLFFDVSS